MESCSREDRAQVEENSSNNSVQSSNVVNHDEIEDTLIGDDSARGAMPVISATEEDELLKNDEDPSVEDRSLKSYEPNNDGRRPSVHDVDDDTTTTEQSYDGEDRPSKGEGETSRVESRAASSALNSVESVEMSPELSNSVGSITELRNDTNDDGYSKVVEETSAIAEIDVIDENPEKEITRVVTVDTCDESSGDDHCSRALADGMGDKNPIELENENSEDNERTIEEVHCGAESESMDVDEIDRLSESCEKNDASTVSKSAQFEKAAARNTETESCIIPDAMDSTVSANSTTDAGKSIKKFDITPVRLEKLMDPQKLANKMMESSLDRNISTSGRPQRQAAKKAETQIKEMVALTDADGETVPDGAISTAVCSRCCLLRPCRWMSSATMNGNFCVEGCWKIVSESKLNAAKPTLPNASSLRIVPTTMKLQTVSIRVPQQIRKAPINPSRKCAQCEQHIAVEEKALAWEAMEFCNEDCLNRYQKKYGSFCQYSQCKKAVPHTSMGKYAVRFGLEARQFCSGSCLEEFKKILKSCGYCQKDVTQLANTIRVTSEDKHSTKEFCSVSCRKFYECVNLKQPLPEVEDECTVCTTRKNVEFQVVIDSRTYPLCSDVCNSAFNFANNIKETDQCHVCKKYFEKNSTDAVFVYHEDMPFKFCSRVCTNVFILFKRKIVPCSWCKVKKYNFDMIKKTSNTLTAYLCSINCLTLYQVSINASSSRKIKCDFSGCAVVSTAQYHLTMSDATIRNFCSYHCVMCFQTQYSKNMSNSSDQNKPSITTPVPLGEPKKAITAPAMSTKTINTNVITVSKPNVAIANGFLPQMGTNSATTLKVTSPLTVVTSASTSLTPVITSTSSMHAPKQVKYVQQVVVRPPEPKEVANKSTQCKPCSVSKSIMCEPVKESVQTQTDECMKYPALVPIPVPIYVPVPVMYSVPYPVPVPFPLPVPVPIFVPTTQKTFKALTAKIKEILEKTPSNPLEADLLMMAKMVEGEERVEEEMAASGSRDQAEGRKRSRDAERDSKDARQRTESPSTSRFCNSVLQETSNDASKELSNSRSGVDLEAELTSNTITPNIKSFDKTVKAAEEPEPEIERPRTRKRAAQEAQQKAAVEAPPIKTRRRQSQQQQQSQALQSSTGAEPKVTNGSIVKQNSTISADSSVVAANDTDRPDAGMCLKYTIGIRGWKQWVIQKNEQIERAAAVAHKKAKVFNTNILKLTTDELNYLLCAFVKEVRKPNGSPYAPDTIYYLCLSIQQYLSENSRVDNIFTDPTYEQFTNALDEVAVKFSEINESTQYVLTRVEEEHLWESKQLGAYSPHVLLATLLFFNTKYFNLATVEEHMHLSFSHIMKHWKRNSNGSSGKPGSPAPNRNVLLRYYSTQAALDAPNSRKKKVYEQHENDTDPLRCPVRLYEFYLSKCPDSVKQRNDLFYLQPESSCVPDSPVWYSTMPLQKDVLKKILHRILMVKEVNMSLLAS